MLKRVFLVLAFSIFLLTIVKGADFNLLLDLNTDQYGPNQSFDGFFTIEYDDNLSGDTVFDAYIENELEASNTLIELLENSNADYISVPATYEKEGNAKSSVDLLFNNYGYRVAGVELQDDDIDMANITITGASFAGDYPSYVKVDVGDDGEIEWQHTGDAVGWEGPYYPEGIEGDENSEGNVQIRGDRDNKKCDYINISFNEFLESTEIRVTVKARKLTNGGDLVAEVEGGNLDEVCDLPEPGTSYTEVSCILDNDDPRDGVYELCVYSDLGDHDVAYYSLPYYSYEEGEYYFTKIEKRRYDYVLDGGVDFSGERLIDALEDNHCGAGCLVPIKVQSDSAGKVTLSNLRIIDDGDREIDKMYEVDYVPEQVAIDESLEVPLIGFDDLRTPGSFGNYTLEIDSDDEDVDVEFTVTNVPVAIISLSSKNVATGYTVNFDGSESKGYGSYEIFTYDWDFGDGSTAYGETTSHVYYAEGNYTVRLVVTDERGIKSSADTVTIFVGDLEDIIDDMLLDAQEGVDDAEIYFSNVTGSVKEVYDKGYRTLLSSAKNNISQLNSEFIQIKTSVTLSDSEKQERYSDIAEQLEWFTYNVPKKLQVFGSLIIENDVIRNVYDVPVSSMTRSYSDINAFNEQIYKFNQESVSLDSYVKSIKFTSLDGASRNIKFVEKSVASSGTLIVEDLSNVVSDIDDVVVLSPAGYVKNEYNENIEWNLGTADIIYVLEGGGDLEEVGRTVVFKPVSDSGDVENICGNGRCEYNLDLGIQESDSNNAYYCPEDCSKELPLGIYILLLVIVVVGALYLNFYKGPGNFKDISNRLSIKLFKKRLFTNQQDLVNLRNYINASLRRGANQASIRRLLMQKGWTKEQIDYAMKKR